MNEEEVKAMMERLFARYREQEEITSEIANTLETLWQNRENQWLKNLIGRFSTSEIYTADFSNFCHMLQFSYRLQSHE
jgi:hypothetical protein